MMAKEAKTLNVCIIPDDRVIDEAILMSQAIAEHYPTEFVLDRGIFKPHITLYEAHFPTSNIDQMVDALSKLTSVMSPCEVELTGKSVNYDTFMFWDCLKTPLLQETHNRVLFQLNPLREGLNTPDLDSVTGMNEEDQLYIKNYGDLLVGARFSPHVTLTRISQAKDAPAVLKLIQEKNATNFVVSKLTLAYGGPNGTVTDVIETFQFYVN